MIRISAIGHWGIPVNDLDEAERFYTAVLGLTPLGRFPNGVMTGLEICGQQLVLFQRKEPLTRTPEQDSLLHPVAFEQTPEDWESAARLIHERRIPPALPIQYRTGGRFPGRELYVLDPSGNMIELRDAAWTPDQPRPTFQDLVSAPLPAGA